jgi:predicted transcriptional regulator
LCDALDRFATAIARLAFAIVDLERQDARVDAIAAGVDDAFSETFANALEERALENGAPARRSLSDDAITAGWIAARQSDSAA